MKFGIFTEFVQLLKHHWSFKVWCIYLALISFLFYFTIPNPLFKAGMASPVLYDKDGALLNSKTALDGQWRMQSADVLPAPLEECMIAKEDEWFYYHLGINPMAFFQAIVVNAKAQKVVRGASTIDMQVISLARGFKSKGLLDKVFELVMACRLQFSYDKRQILRLYANNAPFGGNVVGYTAACRRYFDKSPSQMSWGEAALLAVLPNNPSFVNFNKGRNILYAHRNALLSKLLKKGKIDQITYETARLEVLPTKWFEFPQLATHLLDHLVVLHPKNSNFYSNIDRNKQIAVEQLAASKLAFLKGLEVHNLAIIVAETSTGNVVSYLGNLPGTHQRYARDVDIVQARRSTGSILKPFLTTFMFNEGLLLPKSLLKDIPVSINGFRPDNFLRTYDGVVSTEKALSRSLNIPFALLLRDYGVNKFHQNLKEIGFSTFEKNSEHYGLSLILGGGETSLFELVSNYAFLGRVVQTYYESNGKYGIEDNMPLFLLKHERPEKKLVHQAQTVSAGAAWSTLQCLKLAEKPLENGIWEMVDGLDNVYWKTGTSFGNRDAWCIGVSGKYTIGVWVGNANGEGRASIIGVDLAAPIMFELFKRFFNPGGALKVPFDDFNKFQICAKSGYLPTAQCPINTVDAPAAELKLGLCPYHKLLHLDHQGEYQVNENCYDINKMKNVPWFLLSPLEKEYYVLSHGDYLDPPPLHPNCSNSNLNESIPKISWIYPQDNLVLNIPKSQYGLDGMAILKVAHSNPNAVIKWYLNQELLGTTKRPHHLNMVYHQPGKYLLTVEDESGHKLVKWVRLSD